jgi:hypothetical protein
VSALLTAAANPSGQSECPCFLGVTSSGISWSSYSLSLACFLLNILSNPLAFASLFKSFSSISLTPNPA